MSILFLLYLIVLVMDLMFPSGIEGGIIHIIPMIYSTQVNGRKTIAVCSVTSLIIAFGSGFVNVDYDSAVSIHTTIYNRGFVAIGILIVWYLLDRIKRYIDERESITKALYIQEEVLINAKRTLEEEVEMLGHAIANLQMECTEQEETLELLRNSEKRLAKYVSDLE